MIDPLMANRSIRPGHMGPFSPSQKYSTKKNFNRTNTEEYNDGPKVKKRNEVIDTAGYLKSVNDQRHLIQHEGKTEIHSSLPLQMLIYFNIWYSITFITIEIALFIYKWTTVGLTVLEMILYWVALVIWFLIEPLRLLAGHSGNLSERVPRLAAFMVITVVAFALQIFYAGFIGYRLSLDTILATIMMLFLVAEFIIGIEVIYRIIKVTSIRYHLHFNSDGTLYVPPETSDNKVEEIQDGGYEEEFVVLEKHRQAKKEVEMDEMEDN